MPKIKIPTFTIDSMLKRNGKYVITNISMLKAGVFANCEVEDGKCWQLTKEGVRDDELSREGWMEGVILFAKEDWDKAIEDAMKKATE